MKFKVGDFYAVPRKGATISDKQKKVLKAAMDKARKRMNAICNFMEKHKGAKNIHQAFKDSMEIYFRLGKAELKGSGLTETFDFITKNLVLIRDGLNKKDEEIVDAAPSKMGVDMTTAAGYVRMSFKEFFKKKDPKRPANFTGRIHIKYELLKEGKEDEVAALIIHEASHKFTGTRDWAYLPNGPNESLLAYQADWIKQLGSKQAVMKAWEKDPYFKIVPVQALNNADSFAGFAYTADMS